MGNTQISQPDNLDETLRAMIVANQTVDSNKDKMSKPLPQPGNVQNVQNVASPVQNVVPKGHNQNQVNRAVSAAPRHQSYGHQESQFAPGKSPHPRPQGPLGNMQSSQQAVPQGDRANAAQQPPSGLGPQGARPNLKQSPQGAAPQGARPNSKQPLQHGNQQVNHPNVKQSSQNAAHQEHRPNYRQAHMHAVQRGSRSNGKQPPQKDPQQGARPPSQQPSQHATQQWSRPDPKQYPQNASQHGNRPNGQQPAQPATQQGNRQTSKQYPPPREQSLRPNPRSRPSQFTPLAQNRQMLEQMVHRQCDFLERAAHQQVPQVAMTSREFHEKDSFRALLERHCRDAVNNHYGSNAPFIEIVAFGSLVSGFGMPGSDMDLAFLTLGSATDMPRLLERVLLDQGYGARLLTRTRVPILKVCEKPTPEIYNALFDERKKWDDMTPEQREQHDNPKPEENIKGGKKPSLECQTSDPEQPSSQVTPADPGLSPNGSQTLETGLATTSPSSRQLDNGVSTANVDGKPKSGKPKNPKNRKDGKPSPDATENMNAQPPHPGKPNEQATPQDQKGNDGASNPKASPPKPRMQRPWYREKRPGPLDFPKQGVGIQCDINFSNPLGIHNTALLRCYSAADVRVKVMVLFIKAWASHRRINSSYNGTLSSYGYVLMVLHYLVNVASPPVCPNLQLEHPSLRLPVPEFDCQGNWGATPPAGPPNVNDPKSFCNGWDIRFWRDEAMIEQLASQGKMTANKEPIGSLLRGFFHYFAHQGPQVTLGGFRWIQDVLSLRSPGGILSKQEKQWTGAQMALMSDAGGSERQIKQRYLLAIEDPFERDHNVGRPVTHFGVCAIRDEFRRAWKILEAVGVGKRVDDLFEEVVDIAPQRAEQNEVGKSKEANQEGRGVEERKGEAQGIEKDDEHQEMIAASTLAQLSLDA